MKYDNSTIRRQDRLLSEDRALKLLETGEYGFLALTDTDGPYVLPLSYVFSKGKLYFHCAPEGRKLRVIGDSCRACFSVVGNTRVQPDSFTTLYESVICTGRICLVEGTDQKREALRQILKKYSPGHMEKGLKYMEGSLHRTAILVLEIESLSGKSKPGYAF